MFDNFFIDYMSNIIPVAFNLKSDKETKKIGTGEAQFTVTLNKPISKSELLTSTSLALGEAYMRGDLEVDKDLYEVLNLFLGQMGKFTTNKSKLHSLLFSATSKGNQKKEVTAHYDIGNEFYSLWLDETLSYSCAYFKDENNTLYEAQMNKIHHTLEKLSLEPGMTLLDIGCGWGALLIEAAKKYQVKGTGITLSEEQYKKFKERIKEENLEELLNVEIMDYRDLGSSDLSFDRVVSVGMLDHVGRDNYELFIKNVHQVLKEKGVFLLHSITALKEHPGDAWIKKYIFPGGTVPSFRELIHILPEYQFYTLDVESLRRHYNRTLLLWRKRFLEHRDEIVTMMGEEFTRMWEIYLSSCAATFNNGIIDIHQILVSKGAANDLPMIRVV
jgi:cyclopropane-fatty-acyl-phospholipid synthase